jgi:hypothetical protein
MGGEKDRNNYIFHGSSIDDSRPFEAGVLVLHALAVCLVHLVALEGLNGCSSWTIETLESCFLEEFYG